MATGARQVHPRDLRFSVEHYRQNGDHFEVDEHEDTKVYWFKNDDTLRQAYQLECHAGEHTRSVFDALRGDPSGLRVTPRLDLRLLLPTDTEGKSPEEAVSQWRVLYDDPENGCNTACREAIEAVGLTGLLLDCL